MSARKHAEPVAPDPVSMLSVYTPGPAGVGTMCIGFLFLRGRGGVEAYDQNTRSLGILVDQKSAADAISAAAAIEVPHHG